MRFRGLSVDDLAWQTVLATAMPTASRRAGVRRRRFGSAGNRAVLSVNRACHGGARNDFCGTAVPAGRVHTGTAPGVAKPQENCKCANIVAHIEKLGCRRKLRSPGWHQHGTCLIRCASWIPRLSSLAEPRWKISPVATVFLRRAGRAAVGALPGGGHAGLPARPGRHEVLQRLGAADRRRDAGRITRRSTGCRATRTCWPLSTRCWASSLIVAVRCSRWSAEASPRRCFSGSRRWRSRGDDEPDDSRSLTLVGGLAAMGWMFFVPAQAYSDDPDADGLPVAAFWFVVWWTLRRRAVRPGPLAFSGWGCSWASSR